MREVSIWLNAHASPGDMGVFKSVAELSDACDTDEVYHVKTGLELVALANDLERQGGHAVDHLVISGHGGPTWLLDDEYGVTTGRVRHAGQVTAWQVCEAWAQILHPRPLVSLAACLCSRSPSWLLTNRWTRPLGSDWGPRAYLPGGLCSMSGLIRDGLHMHGLYPRVRGHRGSGHASACSLLAEHGGPPKTPCTTLFQRALEGLEPTPKVRLRWVRLVTGKLAQRWLLGDDSVEEEIARRWYG